jgi:hypothetical protein
MVKTRVLYPMHPVALLPVDKKYVGRQTWSLDQRNCNTRLGPVTKAVTDSRSVSRASIPCILHECKPQPRSSPGVPLVISSWAFKHNSVEELLGTARHGWKLRARMYIRWSLNEYGIPVRAAGYRMSSFQTCQASFVICFQLSALPYVTKYKWAAVEKDLGCSPNLSFQGKSENPRHTGRGKTMYANKRIGWGTHIAKPIKDPDLWSTYVVF